MKPQALLSVHPSHINKYGTEKKSYGINDLKAEITSAGFSFTSEHFDTIIHYIHLIDTYVYNFTKVSKT